MSARPRRTSRRAPRSGEWARQVAARPERTETLMALLIVLAVVLLVVVGLALYGWMVDRQLHRGVLQQRAQAGARADWQPLGTLPAHVPEAILAVVDPLFFERTRPELGVEESLTRDLVRQLHQLGGNLPGQARELTLGVLLDYRLQRSEVLELYLNRVSLGEHEGAPVFGVHHAAREFFESEPRELTLGQAATIAGILLPPRLAEPALWPGALGARRNEVLQLMLARGSITPEEMAVAIGEPLRLQQAAAQAPMTRPDRWLREPEVIRVSPTEPAAVGAPTPPTAPPG